MKTPIALIAIAALLGGCANTSTPNSTRPVASAPQSYVVYGVIDAIEAGQGSSELGAGTIIGGVVGGILGNQVGGGSGRDVATIAGAVGGAVVGHQIEKSRQQPTYNVRVRMNNGDYQTVTQQNVSDLRVGDRVRIENNVVTRDR